MFSGRRSLLWGDLPRNHERRTFVWHWGNSAFQIAELRPQRDALLFAGLEPCISRFLDAAVSSSQCGPNDLESSGFLWFAESTDDGDRCVNCFRDLASESVARQVVDEIGIRGEDALRKSDCAKECEEGA